MKLGRKAVTMGKIAVLGAAIAAAVPLQAQFNLGGAIDAARRVANAVTVSDAEMVTMFGQMSAEMDSMNPVAQPGDPYADRLASLTSGLENYDGLDLDIKAYRVSDVNAFAMGDGTVRVMAGLMDGFEDNEIRCVIGHEIGHVKLQHSAKRMRSALQQDAALSVAGTASGEIRQLADSQLGQLIGQVVEAQYSQADENAADDYALTFMRNNNYDVQGCPAAMDKLAAMGGGGGGVSLLQTHPSPQSRARRMRRQLD